VGVERVDFSAIATTCHQEFVDFGKGGVYTSYYSLSFIAYLLIRQPINFIDVKLFAQTSFSAKVDFPAAGFFGSARDLVEFYYWETQIFFVKRK